MKYGIELFALKDNEAPSAIDFCVLNETQYKMLHEYLLGFIDIEPVRHGKWNLTHSLYDHDEYECSVCCEALWLKRGIRPKYDYKYCPHCGAKMDGDE